ncbi:hypothetical protein L1987_01640 [Smallanthus sonchifolius]|uniref:Uncharacterized protein n=1 Tax=Smallanthus sonchifolius TaxID=185202 RepID=A0ACB9K5P3_9ASTR|nr:hypothetical protein L1987_01640 [Smallanthus sonchifolius]
MPSLSPSSLNLYNLYLLLHNRLLVVFEFLSFPSSYPHLFPDYPQTGTKIENRIAIMCSQLYFEVNVISTTGTSSQFGVSTSDGHYVPAVAGGTIPQPRPTQLLPVGSGDDLHAYHMDDEEMMRVKAERGGKAGGWSLELSRKRALEEAFGSIWI